MTDIDFEQEGLLAGCETEEARAGRVQLLENLVERGVSLQELSRAVDEQRFVLLPVELELAGTPKYSGLEVAELSGVEYQVLEDNWRALGMTVASPEAVAFTEDDLESAKRRPDVPPGRVARRRRPRHRPGHRAGDGAGGGCDP